MNKLLLTFLLASALLATDAFCQKGPARYFGKPILTDSLSTVFIPTRYNEEFLSSNKIAFWGDYYANIVAYNFQTDTYKKIFEKDGFIEAIEYDGFTMRTTQKSENITKKWVFLLVKMIDTNNSGRIDEKDPSLLFAVSPDGQTINQLTDEKESVVSLKNFEKQGFVLIKIQKDTNNDKEFRSNENEYFFRKINLSDLTSGNAIEIK
ncbi:MAG TPA: hypothetical protein VD927_10955 [Chryseosolibacter sp.]|nr:hypothetical protein [Chryseosolibacter sp.]